MADQLAAYRIWQSPEGVLIQGRAGSIELSIAEATALAADINLRVVPDALKRKNLKWTPELIEEVTRLYRNEGLGAHRIAKAMGVSTGSINGIVRRAGVIKHPSPAARNLIAARAAKRARQAARAPTLLGPKPEIVDTGKVRLGDGFISAEFPQRHGC